MATRPYPQQKPNKNELPIVTYANQIGKNTAEFTAKDLRRFLRWLWKVEPCKNKQFVVSTANKWSSQNVRRDDNARNKRQKTH